jgi:hypothetical protein
MMSCSWLGFRNRYLVQKELYLKAPTTELMAEDLKGARLRRLKPTKGLFI